MEAKAVVTLLSVLMMVMMMLLLMVFVGAVVVVDNNTIVRRERPGGKRPDPICLSSPFLFFFLFHRNDLDYFLHNFLPRFFLLCFILNVKKVCVRVGYFPAV